MEDKKFEAKKRGRPPKTPRREIKSIQRKLKFLNNIPLPTSNRFSALSNSESSTDES